MSTVKHLLLFVYPLFFIVLYDQEILNKYECSFFMCSYMRSPLVYWGEMVKFIFSSINVSTLRPPEGAGDSFFVVPSSNRRATAIWLIPEHEFTSESLHKLPNPRPFLRTTSSDVQSLAHSSALTWPPNLIERTSRIISPLYMASSQLTCKVKHVVFCSYFTSRIAFL